VDAMFQLLWERYRAWSHTSGTLKRKNAAWKRNVLILTIGGTLLATVGPFAPTPFSRILPIAGAAALAFATYLARELLDTTHEQRWTRARTAAEALKSEACKYLVRAAPYDADDRVARLKARIAEIELITKDQAPVRLTAEQLADNMPAAPWTIQDYLTLRLDDQIAWYRDKAVAHTALAQRGRTMTLALGGAAVIVSTVTGATTEGQTLWAAALGLLTTTGAAIGAYFQAGHYDAIALKYLETAYALGVLRAEFAPGADERTLVVGAEAIMQAENAAWLTEVSPKPAPVG
jgi:hypothetical protein